MWAFFGGTSFTTSNYDAALTLNRLANAIGGFIPVFYLGLAISISNARISQSLTFKLSWLVPIICALFSFHPIYIPTVEPKMGMTNYPNPGPLFTVYFLHFAATAFYAELILLRHLKSNDLSSTQRKSGLLITVGTSVGFILGSTTFLTVYNFPIIPYPSCFVWIFALFGTFAIARYNLFGIKISPKEIPYFLVTTCSTLLYLSLSIGFAGFIIKVLDLTHAAHQFIAFLLCGLLLRPLQGAFEYTIAFLLFKTTARQLRDLNHNLFERIEKDRRLSETSILAAGMAHEIKNPLTTLKTFAKFLPDRYQDSDFIKKCALHMQEETDRINNIVLQILEFASSKNLHVTETDASLLIDETISMLNINIVRKSIKISNQTPNPTILIIDKERFRQVLVNILLNAIEACSKNDSITISSTVTRRGFKHGVLFQLSDTGCGMSDEELTRLYDPFYSKNKQNGTGLGMNIVKRIVQDHKGDISVESKPGEGTTFFIFIPVR